MRLIVRAMPRNSPQALHVRAPAVKVASRKLKILDFDIENRPLSYLGSDWTTAEVTAIAWAWTDKPNNVQVRLLGELALPEILEEFCAVYAVADVITGHYVRCHDLPMVNGALTEFGMPGLSDKYVQDTKIDLHRMAGLSKSQESLAAMMELDNPKVQMNQHMWRTANRLDKRGLKWVSERAKGDVQQHMELRQKLLDRGYLGPPRLWRSRSHEPLVKYSA